MITEATVKITIPSHWGLMKRLLPTSYGKFQWVVKEYYQDNVRQLIDKAALATY